MKYKYPETVLIGDTNFVITYDYTSHDGASFVYPTKEEPGKIIFGMEEHKTHPEQFLSFLIHELKEIIQVEQSTRLFNRGKDNYEFHYNHSEHSDLCCRLSGLLTQFIE